MNTAAESARAYITEQTWPRSVNARNKSFAKWALTTKKARKNDLSIVLYDRAKRGNMQLQARGGTKGARGNLAIPSSNVRRGAHGVVKSERPTAIKAVKINGNLFRRKKRGLELMYTLKPNAQIKARFPFYEDAGSAFMLAMHKAWPLALQQALLTARR